MSEHPTPSVREVQKSLDAKQFQWAKTRIEASRQLAADLRQGRSSRTQGVLALEAFLRRDRQPDESVSTSVNATAYEPQRINMVYHAPDEQESVSEGLVFFLKPGEDGQPEMLEMEGEPLFLNRDLYEAHFPTTHTKRIEETVNYVPTVDFRGQIVRIIDLREKSDMDAIQKVLDAHQ